MTYKEAIIQRNAAIAALKQIVKSKNVFQIWGLAYEVLRKLPSTVTARKELAQATKQEHHEGT